MSKHLKNILLPVLASLYPVIFLYSHNVKILELGNIIKPFWIAPVLAVILFGLFLALQRKGVAASLSAVIFLVFFFLYRPLFDFLLKINRFPVDHFIVLPVVISVACYAGYFVSLIKVKTAEAIQNILLLVLGVMITFNIATAFPVEIQKAQLENSKKQAVHAATQIQNGQGQKHPDIYYIIFDEYASFDTIREYWHDNYVDDFKAFLQKKGFFVAEHSRSSSTISMIEVARRLNMAPYTYETTNGMPLYRVLMNNKVMAMAKSYGYTTVVFNGLKLGFPGLPAWNVADYEYIEAPKDSKNADISLNDFDMIVLNNTMFYPALDLFQKSDPWTDNFRKMLLFSVNKTTDLSEIQGPKFVYTHLLFPHTPFMFDEMGRPTDKKDNFNWNYYLRQHKYATKLAEDMVTKLLANADPHNPPIIILQSDHGARNKHLTADSVNLTDFPQEYETHILNALYLPGYDYSQLSDSMDPVDTFVIVLNHYLNANVSVEGSGK